MGTNYFMLNEACEACGRADGPVHIGKSSVGWRMVIRSYPEGEGPTTWAEWVEALSAAGRIVDEYDREITAADLVAKAEAKAGDRRDSHDRADGPVDLAEYEFS